MAKARMNKTEKAFYWKVWDLIQKGIADADEQKQWMELHLYKTLQGLGRVFQKWNMRHARQRGATPTYRGLLTFTAQDLVPHSWRVVLLNVYYL